MTVPLSTTTVTVTKPTPGDRYEPAAGASTLASGVAAHISGPSGLERIVGGQQSVVDAVLLSDPIAELDAYCTVLDEVTGAEYQVAWVTQRQGLGLDHTKAGLNKVVGAHA